MDATTVRQVSERATRVLAPNAGPMTLDGTNTYVLREGTDVVVVDPGPDDAGHLGRVLEVATADGGRVALVVLTHHHRDHTAGADALAERTGAPVRGAGRGEPFADGERLAAGALGLTVLTTPGHTADSVCLLLPADGLLLTGDTVLGRGSTVLAWPDGDVTAYLATLDRLLALARSHEVVAIAPGHGPHVDEPAATLENIRTHRNARLAEVRAAVAAGARTPEDVVRRVYGDVDPALESAAGQSARAQLAHLGIVPRT